MPNTKRVLPADTWNHLETLMQTEKREYFSDWARANVAQGEVKGQVDALLSVLSARGLEVPDDVRKEIVGCDDVDRLGAWIRMAVTVDSARELLKHSG
ncbi:hypothetical protein [Actinomadura xylanilytica]|uniref:hypothetical protein n=1 Tax=Actinomadura xylanilytica TaxID=887459 RepID=UPI00255B2C91|nr:hypothetical protein [Actinomadura xylanilytica]MDL4775957.1 hypothetical protein [Actinomadura xylanilytica]